MKQIAKIAVTITQTIKENLETDPQEVIKLILDELPDLSVDDLTTYLLTLDKQVGNVPISINDMISFIQKEAKENPDGIRWASLWQNLAQGLVFVGHVIAELVPPKWSAIILAVLGAYEELKGQ